ncbi:copper resistance system multicopper oxidase [Novosphingobium mangrovi (ex Hu et al. 2023)]|uniref:Copper resistance system multicopper oxidase n=1 Tax=Novosphingobium mangrovi (ex Hu et al. 2023) TaxID=2930094 RepID=A0ABT0ABI5_9SPHN|nr:copper resistance system multicopper oxidase [Novosphingobium mangrovi (ex Hu et al. 2023)]MCJ1960545.1 copper resistance system multicopper oxidase [Novosphingobium mangrovi (ex Hu et al. 2023)]
MFQTPHDRRALLAGALTAGGGAAASLLFPHWARAQMHHHHGAHTATGTATGATTEGALSGEHIALNIARTPFTLGGRTASATTVNGTVPGPLIRLREGQDVELAVTNHLDVDSSIHWHGILLPFQMDGVPGVTFPGIAPHETFTYRFPVRQSGTYWYHSHSGGQEGTGLFGPLVIDPAHGERVETEREMILMLSDWSFTPPMEIWRKLKARPDYYNFQQQALFENPSGKPWTQEQKLAWGRMRMSPMDIADVTGATYTYLINGQGPDANWTGLFRPGERVRLRVINASAMTIFNLRIPGLPFTVIAADGSDVAPVETDEIQIGVAETYDLVVTPDARAYSVIAESSDRSGFARATLAPRAGMVAPVPPLRKPPRLTMKDMGMGDRDETDHSDHAMGSMEGMDHGDGGMAMNHSMRDPATAPGVELTPGVDMLAPMPTDRTGERGLGLDDVDHRVLVYTDLETPEDRDDLTPPTREIVVHLTGNMERYMWSFDGRRFSEMVEPIRLAHNERVRFTLVNETMMTHPIHLHGFFFDLVNGAGKRRPRKHTVSVLPAGKVSFDVTADAPGDWAFHCHLLLHMMSGMFNVVTVRPLEGGAA